jgi:hypothetical protein
VKPLALALLLAAFLGGCGGADAEDAPPPNASGEVETLISRQLPDKVRRMVGPTAYVEGVRCIQQDSRAYECIASVSGSNAYTGRPERVQLPINATCDERACIWKISP